jgi:hypothetical protein
MPPISRGRRHCGGELLLDEMLSPAIARELRSRGYDVESVAGHPLHHEAITPGGAGHFGMIFVPGGYRRSQADTGRIVVALEALLAQYPGEQDLANGEAWL